MECVVVTNKLLHNIVKIVTKQFQSSCIFSNIVMADYSLVINQLMYQLKKHY